MKWKNEQKTATFVALREVMTLPVFTDNPNASTKMLGLPPLPAIIIITRIGPRRMDDDNLATACKYVRDQIARAYDVDDGSSLYTWRYDQQPGPYAVEIEIISKESEKC